MAAIFGSKPTFGGAFAMDEATLTFSTNGAADGGLGFLVQSLSVQYQRPVQRIFELGPKKTTYYVTGRAEGQMQIARLAAPAPVNNAFLTKFSDVCQVDNNFMSITVGSGATCTGTIAGQPITPSRYKFSYCLIASIAFQIAVDAIALTENISMVFAAMENSLN